MVLLGTIVNGLLIVIGSILGLFFTKIPEKYKETVMNGIGLVVLLIGLQMAFQTDQVIIVLLSLLTGALIGEWIDLEGVLNRLGNWVGDKVSRNNEETSISQGL